MKKTTLDKFAEISELVKSNDIYDIHDLKLNHLTVLK